MVIMQGQLGRGREECTSARQDNGGGRPTEHPSKLRRYVMQQYVYVLLLYALWQRRQRL